MARFQARSLPFTRLYNGVVYAVSAIIYSAILAVLDWVAPGQHVFVPGAPQRDPFMSIVICSWAVMGVGALCLLVLYYPSKPRDKKRSRRYPEVTFCVLLIFALAFALIAAGLAASIAAAVFVFIGGRDRYRILERDTSSLRAWAIPILTGGLPAVFFAFMTLGLLRSLYFTFKSMSEYLSAPPVGSDGDPASNGVPSFGAPLTPEQEGKVSQLVAAGYQNRNANIAALQASSFDPGEAQSRLARAQPQSV